MSNEYDLHARLAPLRDLMRAHRETNLDMSAVRLSKSLGRGDTWITELELGRKARGYGVERLADWARAVEAQEFGLYIVLNGVYTDIPLIDPEEM